MFGFLKKVMGGECCGGKKSCDAPEGKKQEMKAGCCGGAHHAHGHDHHHHDDEDDATRPGKGGCCG